jgi:hypothetical protein
LKDNGQPIEKGIGMSKIKITYSIDDGYAGGERPLSFEMDMYEFEDDMTEEEIKETVWEAIRIDMEARVHPYWSEREMPEILAELAKGDNA